LSTNLSIEDFDAFLILTRLEYQAGLIKEESTSELFRFTIRHLLKQADNQPEYLILKQEQEKQSQNNQQKQIHNQVILPPTITITTAHHQSQVPNISCRNNLAGQKMTSWKLSTLLLTHTNRPYYSDNNV
jgi:hypothetical protein